MHNYLNFKHDNMNELKVAKDVSAFVKSLVIPADHEHAALTNLVRTSVNYNQGLLKSTSTENQESASVNAGSLTSFTGKMTGERKSDVQNSTLLAQLAADKKFDRMKDAMNWYKFYIDVLSNVGWVTSAFAFDKYTSGGTTVKLDEAVIGILSAIATGDEIAIVKATMNSLQALGDDTKQMRIWNSNASDGNNGNFQIFPVSQEANGDAVMMMDGMQFVAHESHGRFLWWSWQSNQINIQRAANKFVLDNDVYSQVRQQIIDKLGDKAKTFIAELDI